MTRPRRQPPRPLVVAMSVGMLLAGSLAPSPAALTVGAAGPAALRGLAYPVSPPTTQPIMVQATRVPAFSHIYLIVFENHEYSSIIGNRAAPYLNALARRYGLATNYYATTHPSLPNYLALFSGSTQGVTDDGVHNLATRNLVDQLGAHHLGFHAFAQNVPLGCYLGATASGGPDGTGTYARKHEPAISFTDISHSPRRCAAIQDFRHFSPTAARFELIVPNMCNSMHDCSVARGDTWLRGFLPRILRSSVMATSVVFVTWDEGSTSLRGGGKVATLVIGPRVKPGFRSAVSHNHYSLLRTIQDAWGLGCLNHTCTANDMREFFR